MSKRREDPSPLVELLRVIGDIAEIPPTTREYPFYPGRRWAFDAAWPDLKVALEYEGSTWAGGRHTTGMGYRGDVDKYNSAALLGWCVIRVTADMVRDLSYLDYIVPAILKRTQATEPTPPDQVVDLPAFADLWVNAEIGK